MHEEMWSFTTFYNGVQTRSPRRFLSKEAALEAIVEKLSLHALDGEYPSIGLVAILERINVQPD